MLEEALRRLGNVTLIVDLNRQSLDRVVPGHPHPRSRRMFAAAGWQVLEAKYGRSSRSGSRGRVAGRCASASTR